jgi:VCBS repeat-containing protein
MKKFLVSIAILCASATAVCAKDFPVTLPVATAVRNLKLEPGAYTIRLQGSLVFFVDKHGKSVSALAKQEKAEDKAKRTTMETSKEGDQARITAIALEGSEFKLTFAD